MRYAKWLILSMALLLSDAASADEHAHVWGTRTCGAWETVGRCRARQCYRNCTYPGCPQVLLDGDRECSRGEAPLTIWGPRPGSVGSDACPPHDFGEEQCGGWSEMSPGCKVRHCTRRCNKCGSNGRDRLDESPPGCF